MLVSANLFQITDWSTTSKLICTLIRLVLIMMKLMMISFSININFTKTINSNTTNFKQSNCKLAKYSGIRRIVNSDHKILTAITIVVSVGQQNYLIASEILVHSWLEKNYNSLNDNNDPVILLLPILVVNKI